MSMPIVCRNVIHLNFPERFILCFLRFLRKSAIYLRGCNLLITFGGVKVREVVVYKHYFEDFFKEQNRKVQDKIIKVLDILEQVERVPLTYLRYIEGTNGLFEVRVQSGNNIFRIFCCFDGNKLVVLFSGFQKKTQKTPPGEIARAERIMTEYYNEKNKNNG